jgi:hypothetical protein
MAKQRKIWLPNPPRCPKPKVPETVKTEVEGRAGEIYSGQTTGGDERQSHAAGREALYLLAKSRAEEKRIVDCLQHPLRSRYR